MAQSQNTTTDEPLTLNHTALTDIDAAQKALSYLHDEYHDGSLHIAEGGDCLVVMTRSARFQHFSLFQQSEALKISNTRAVLVDGHPRLKVEIREADQ